MICAVVSNVDVELVLMGATDVNGTETSTVTGSHVLVQSLDSIRTGELAELLVHVVGARARVVAQPDTEVLDLQRALLMDLILPIRAYS